MRSSVLFASALVVGAVARPHLNPHLRNHRIVNVVTEVAVETVYVVITVTAGEEQATSTSSCVSTTAVAASTPCTTSSSSAFRQPPVQTPAPENRLKPEEKPKPGLESSPKSHVLPMSSSFSLESKSLSTPEPSSKAAPVPSPALSSTTKPDKLESSSEVAATPSFKPAPAPSPPLESKPAFTPSPAPNPDPKPTLTPAASSAPPTSQPSSDGHIRGPAEAFLSSGPDYVAAMLYHHNSARENHGAEPLTWDDSCEANARIAAEKCNFSHYIPDGAGQGQNLFTVSGRAFNATAGVTESWYKGELKPMMPWFGQPDIPDDVFHEVGHLTQIVWKDTNKVGCVSVDCGNKMIVGGRISTMSKYTVCNYAPAGNVYGAYALNVAGPISNSNLGGWAD